MTGGNHCIANRNSLDLFSIIRGWLLTHELNKNQRIINAKPRLEEKVWPKSIYRIGMSRAKITMRKLGDFLNHAVNLGCEDVLISCSSVMPCSDRLKKSSSTMMTKTAKIAVGIQLKALRMWSATEVGISENESPKAYK